MATLGTCMSDTSKTQPRPVGVAWCAFEASQLLQSCEEYLAEPITQGFKANPGLKLANAFSVLVAQEFSHTLGSGGSTSNRIPPFKLIIPLRYTTAVILYQFHMRDPLV